MAAADGPKWWRWVGKELRRVGDGVANNAMTREVAAQLGASAPDGFVVKARRQFVEWNARNIQWLGERMLMPNEAEVFVIPAKAPGAGSGNIVFVFGFAVCRFQLGDNS